MNASPRRRLWLKTLCALLGVAALGAGCQSPLQFARHQEKAPLPSARGEQAVAGRSAGGGANRGESRQIALASHTRQEELPGGMPMEGMSEGMPMEMMPAPGGPHQPTPPHELQMSVLPRYVIEPPDILVIEAVRVVPRPPYRLQSLDVLSIDVRGALPDAPIAGEFAVQPGGIISLGPPYGIVNVNGMTIPEAGKAIEDKLRQQLRDPVVGVSLLASASQQQIAGEHLVGPDGTVNLGTYGSVQVVGMTVDEAKRAIEAHLSRFLDGPEVAVTVFAYNSKVYYIVTEGANLGDGVYRFPITGNDKVLDAVSLIGGLSEVASSRMWIARPSPDCTLPLILPVDWNHITARGDSATNYQLMPGDRLFIAEDKLVAFDNGLAKLLAPIERAFGFTLLGQRTAASLSGKVLNNFGGQGGGFGGGF
jgi:polysaccharide export outer membrane protein